MSQALFAKPIIAPFAFLIAIVFGAISPDVIDADEKPGQISVATWNLEWFYDHHTGDNFSDLAKKLSAPSKEEWDWRVEQVAATIAKMNPTILALQEIENRHVLFDLRNKLREKHDLDFKIAFIEGFEKKAGYPADMVGASTHTAVLVMAEALKQAGAGDKAEEEELVGRATAASIPAVRRWEKKCWRTSLAVTFGDRGCRFPIKIRHATIFPKS